MTEELRTISDFQAAPKAVKLKYLYGVFGKQNNDFTLNGNLKDKDKLYLGIYSDYLNQMITCGSYELEDLDLVIFNSLEVPCISEIIITLYKENELFSDEIRSVRIDCS